ncbi:MAG: T9SS type A sorting domain-containing protein, partial [Candidatus Eisenbacteria sp.]|nr:T9SS type A sorting domain-containing protein [Candidatus Eisenbacteria bacterium]
GPSPHVYALRPCGMYLVAGGWFTEAGGSPANYVAYWDGSDWHAMGLGVDYQVKALGQFENKLYAGGFFTQAGGGPSFYIARCDGAPSSSVGRLPSESCLSLTLDPNPIQERTTVRYSLSDRGRVRLTVHDVTGRRLHTLADGIECAGSHLRSWRMWDASRGPLGPGVYFLRLEAGGSVSTRKATVVR